MSPRDAHTTRPLAGTSFHVLLALADEPRYGLGIAEEVARRSGGEVQLGPGTLYTAIRRMLEEGLIEEVEGAPDDESDPRRRYYRITGPGRASLAAEARRLETLLDAARVKRVLPGA